MRLANLIGPDLQATLRADPEGLQRALSAFHAEDVAEILDDLSLEEALEIVLVLSAEQGASVLERLSSERQGELLRALPADRVSELLRVMSPDDRVDFLQGLSEDEAALVLAHLEKAEPEVAEEIRELTVWPEDTAGGLMTTEYVSLSPETKVWEAIEAARRVSRERVVETIYYIYVCAYGDKLLGVVSLRDLILGDPGQALSDVMTENVVRVGPSDDQEQVAETMAKYDFSALPVVDERGRMLGVVTVDDVVDVVIQEATEDAQKMGGVVPLESSYFETGLGEFIWKRAAWLIVLFLGQMLTASVMQRHEGFLATMLNLVVFIPLIIASGGNSGSQSSSLVIRALAIGEIGPLDWWRVLQRELVIGVCLGLLLGVIGFGRAYFLGSSALIMPIAIAVSLSILAVVILGTLVGSILPLLIKRLGLDPAVSSTPFIASLVDVLGLVVYFGVAGWVIRFAN